MIRTEISQFTAIVIALSFLFPLFFNGIFKEEEGVSILTLVIMLTLIVISTYDFLRKREKSIAKNGITSLDRILVMYLVYLFLHVLFIGNNRYEPIFAIKAVCLIVSYIFIRYLHSPQIVLVALIVSGFIQSIICFGQLIGIIESSHSFFDITGTFMNPGQLGCFLSLSMIASLGLMLTEKRERKWIIVIASLFIFFALLLSDSRSAWVATLTGGIFIYIQKQKRWFKHNLRKILVIAVPMMLIAGWLLFVYRPSSVIARFLIWKVSVNRFADNPLIGNGIGFFSREYMTWQGEYFAIHPTSYFISVANNVTYPYNEWLHITIEQGLIGLAFIISIVYLLFNNKKVNGGQQAIMGCIVGWSVFAWFSYPVDTFSLLFILCLLVGSVQLPTNNLKLPNIYLFKWLYPVILLGGCYWSIYTWHYYHNCNVLVDNLIRTKQLPSIDNHLFKYNAKMKYNLYFNQLYLNYCLKNENNWFNPEDCVFPNSKLYCHIGDYYMQRKQYRKAQWYYISASNMVPNHLLPNYSLYRLYLSQGDSTMALVAATRALNQFVKLESTFTISARREMNEFRKSVIFNRFRLQ